jgi:hypothetical protein
LMIRISHITVRFNQQIYGSNLGRSAGI